LLAWVWQVRRLGDADEFGHDFAQFNNDP
jgi:hypothetical protein